MMETGNTNWIWTLWWISETQKTTFHYHFQETLHSYNLSTEASKMKVKPFLLCRGYICSLIYSQDVSRNRASKLGTLRESNLKVHPKSWQNLTWHMHRAHKTFQEGMLCCTWPIKKGNLNIWGFLARLMKTTTLSIFLTDYSWLTCWRVFMADDCSVYVYLSTTGL